MNGRVTFTVSSYQTSTFASSLMEEFFTASGNFIHLQSKSVLISSILVFQNLTDTLLPDELEDVPTGSANLFTGDG